MTFQVYISIHWGFHKWGYKKKPLDGLFHGKSINGWDMVVALWLRWLTRPPWLVKATSGMTLKFQVVVMLTPWWFSYKKWWFSYKKWWFSYKKWWFSYKKWWFSYNKWWFSYNKWWFSYNKWWFSYNKWWFSYKKLWFSYKIGDLAIKSGDFP